MRRREPGIQLRGLLIELEASIEHEALEELIALKDEFVDFQVDASVLCPCLGLVVLDGNLDLVGNGQRNLVDQRQDPIQVTIVVLRPEMLVSSGANESGRNANTVGISEDRALDQGVDTELGGDLRHRLLAGVVAQRRGTRNHSEVGRSREPGYQGILHPVDEVALRGIIREVREWQHGDGFDAWPRAPRRLAGRPPGVPCEQNDCRRQYRNDDEVDPPVAHGVAPAVRLEVLLQAHAVGRQLIKP